MRRCVVATLAVGGLLALMTPAAPTSAAGSGGHMSGAPVIRSGTGLAHQAFTAAVRAGSSKPSVADVRFRERDYSLSVDQRAVPAGQLTVWVRNEGKVEHELVAFRTDLDEGALPMTPGGHQVDEHGPGVTHLDPEAEDVQPGSTKTITLRLDPGRYVFICNLPGHYRTGMHIAVAAR
jgi:uncharacterized cupredoxin-like copper-binding protein